MNWSCSQCTRCQACHKSIEKLSIEMSVLKEAFRMYHTDVPHLPLHQPIEDACSVCAKDPCTECGKSLPRLILEHRMLLDRWSLLNRWPPSLYPTQLPPSLPLSLSLLYLYIGQCELVHKVNCKRNTPSSEVFYMRTESRFWSYVHSLSTTATPMNTNMSQAHPIG